MGCRSQRNGSEMGYLCKCVSTSSMGWQITHPFPPSLWPHDELIFVPVTNGPICFRLVHRILGRICHCGPFSLMGSLASAPSPGSWADGPRLWPNSIVWIQPLQSAVGRWTWTPLQSRTGRFLPMNSLVLPGVVKGIRKVTMYSIYMRKADRKHILKGKKLMGMDFAPPLFSFFFFFFFSDIHCI